MTRDDALNAVSGAFGGVRATAVVGLWNVYVETTPPREVVFTADWVALHVGDNVGGAAGLEQMLRSLTDADWQTDPKTGVLFYLVR